MTVLFTSCINKTSTDTRELLCTVIQTCVRFVETWLAGFVCKLSRCYYMKYLYKNGPIKLHGSLTCNKGGNDCGALL